MSAITVYGDIILPDARVVSAQIKGYNEYDTNAFIETSFTLEWQDGGELTADEENERIGDCHLHEWVADQLYRFGTWENDQTEPIDY
jgi:hypothetical protein